MEYLEKFKNFCDELDFQCFFSKNELYLMGTRGLSYCSEKEIIVFLRKKRLSIKGQNLEIDELFKNEIKIKGKLDSLTLID